MTSTDRKFKIKFKSGEDYFIKYVMAKNVVDGLIKFYMNVNCYDVISIEEVED